MALSRSTVNVSLAMLARLSRSGIDQYTVQLGRVLCRNFQLAPRVQDSMEDSIKKLKKYGTCTDLLWFGFGIKQVVTDLAETEEGLSLVALMSSILTCFGTSFSATVLREMCLIMGVSREFMPSLSQWRALLGVCSGILMGSQFELKMQGFHRLHGSSILDRPCDPTCIAHVLSELSAVQSRQTAFLTIAGAADCSWVAAFAESILCLDIALLDENGGVKYRSQDRLEDLPQVNFLTTNVNDGLQITSKSLFLRDCKLIHNDVNPGARDEISMRSCWSTLIRDAFGSASELWLTGKFLPLLSLVYDMNLEELNNLNPATLEGEPPEESRDWLEYFHYTKDICSTFPWSPSMPKDQAFQDFAEAKLPELRTAREYFETTSKHRSEGEIDCLLRECLKDIKLFLIPWTLRIYLHLLYGCHIDHDVSPSSFGLFCVREWLLQPMDRLFRPEEQLKFTTDVVHSVFTSSIDHTYLMDTERGSARSGRGICVYRQGIADFQVDFEHIAKFRICRGYIAYEDQRCISIEDLPKEPEQSIWNRDPVQCSTSNNTWRVEALLRQHLSNQKLYLGFTIHCPRIHHVGQKVFMALESTILGVCVSIGQLDCTCEVSSKHFQRIPGMQHSMPMDTSLAALHAVNRESPDIENDRSTVCLQKQSPQVSVWKSDLLNLEAKVHSQRRQRPSFLFVKNLGHRTLEKCTLYWYDIETLILLWLHQSKQQDLRYGHGDTFLQACDKECVRCHLANVAVQVQLRECASGAMTVYHNHSQDQESLRWECDYRPPGFDSKGSQQN